MDVAGVSVTEPDPWSAIGASATSVFDTLDSSVTVWDRQLRCLYVNAAAVCMLERPAHELLGRPLVEVMGEERFRAYESQRVAAMAGQAVELEWQVLRSGGWRTRRLRLLPRKRVDGVLDGFIAVTDDVTEARAMHQAVSALSASEAKFRALADSLPAGVYHADAQGRNTYTNARWREITGLDAQQSLGDGWRAAIHPDDRDAVLAQWQQVARTGGEFEMAVRLVRPDGTVRHVIGRARPLRGPDGEITGYVGTNEDVTQRHEAERAIERSHHALRTLYEQTPAMLYSIDAEGRLLTVSDQWLAGLGYRREEVLGRSSVDFLTPGSREAVLAEYLPRLWRGERNHRLALQMVRRDGTVLDVLVSAVLERDPEGLPVRGLAVIEDVTAQLDRAAQLRREQVARRELERQAAELARLASERREMLDLLAHEVRQPLNNASAAIESASAMLADKGEQGASARLVRAQGVLSEVQRHVDNTLAVSTLLSSAPAPPEEEADIDTVITVAVAELPRAERSRVTVERFTAARTALMDSALVRLALRNLLGNAIRHTAAGTPVTVRISDSDAPLALFIDIVDEGGGLPAELLPRLFERGARVRHRDGRESHGLGLFIAHRALRVQGGELELLRSGPDGTALRLVLPQGLAG